MTSKGKKISFEALRINGGAGQAPADMPEPGEPAPAAKATPKAARKHDAQETGKGTETGGKTIPVRLTKEQWYEAKEFAMRQDHSLQELFIEGLNMLRAAKGLPPLTGTVLTIK